MPASGSTMLTRLTERSNGSEDKRRLILNAAVRVFARKGFHTCRVGDIAEEAGDAHGLLYHYFRSKDEVLECIFKETWSDIIAAARMVEETDEPARDRLSGIAKILLRAWRRDPDLVRLVVREIVRCRDGVGHDAVDRRGGGALAACSPQPLLDARPRCLRTRVLDHDDLRRASADPAALHRIGRADRARARIRRSIRARALAGDRPV